jgi:hypothetical protein
VPRNLFFGGIFKNVYWSNFVEKFLGENLFFQCKICSFFQEKFATSVKSKFENSEKHLKKRKPKTKCQFYLIIFFPKTSFQP